MPVVEGLDIALAKAVHGDRNGARLMTGNQEMRVVSHQHVRMNVDTVLFRCLAQQLQVMPIVVGVHEHRAAVDSPLDDMQRNVGNFQSRTTRHLLAHCQDKTALNLTIAMSSAEATSVSGLRRKKTML